MIAFIKGELEEIRESSVLIDCNGLGYEVLISQRNFGRLPGMGTQIKLHTWLQVREDGVALFGFLDREELETFKLLIGVNGIGPKGALGILSSISSNDLRFAVLAEDEKTIAKTPGIGPKTAKKLILELKDKFSLEEAFESKLAQGAIEVPEQADYRGMAQEAIEALKALGFSGTEAGKAVSAVEITPDMTADDVLKLALKNIM
ncbi:MAG: Holliday junction branch migration protein RuvA [Lachnospiraceae bacterium]|nr:Holliday junction branch migration protein RuvA [Lachnospiraceae bacterium]